MVRRILVPLDLTALGEAKLPVAEEYARAFDAELLLLHVLPTKAVEPDVVLPTEATARAYLDIVVAGRSAAGIRATSLIRTGPTATTIVEVGPCFVTQVKTLATDGYEAVQLGFDQVRPNKLNKPQRGHLKGDLPPLRTLREVPVEDVDSVSVGDRIDASILNPGERVDVVGVSKGKGFAGVMKRHNFRGGPKTHGQSDRLRAPGSIGSSATPGRVFKGLRMAGHMGHERVTVQNLRVLRVDPERNLLLIEGSVPGPNKGLVVIRRAVKATKK